jgi:hypothetical protein
MSRDIDGLLQSYLSIEARQVDGQAGTKTAYGGNAHLQIIQGITTL